jgi:hypothetical protein
MTIIILLIIHTVIIQLLYFVCFVWQKTDVNNILNLYNDIVKTYI